MVETFRQFSIQDCFLDIETTGLSHYYDEVTLVVGMYDGQDVNTITPLFAYCRSIWICDTCSDVWAIPADSKKSSTDSGSAGLRVSKARLCHHRKLPRWSSRYHSSWNPAPYFYLADAIRRTREEQRIVPRIGGGLDQSLSHMQLIQDTTQSRNPRHVSKKQTEQKTN
jgi:hypothetical protein